jgi:hypothetical protein
MNWTVSGDTIHVTIPHGTVVLTEAQLKEMVKAINDGRREGQRHTGHGKL